MEMPLLHQNTADRSLRDGVSRMRTALLTSAVPERVLPGRYPDWHRQFPTAFRGNCPALKSPRSVFSLLHEFLQNAEGGTFLIPGGFGLGRHLIRMFQSFNDCYTSLATCFRKEGFEPPTHHVVLTARNTLRSGTAAPRRLLCGKPLTCETARLAVPYRIAMA